jgi:hypothetical protein
VVLAAVKGNLLACASAGCLLQCMGTVFNSLSSFAQNSPRMDFVGTVYFLYVKPSNATNAFVNNNFFICCLFFIDAFPRQHQMTINRE